MTHLIAFTQRISVENGFGERRDCLDQRWAKLASAIGALPVALPNICPSQAHKLIELIKPSMVVLTGGNSPQGFHGATPERDAFEHALINTAIKLNLPTIGICRGAQVLNLHFGGSLSSADGHVRERHIVHDDSIRTLSVNSYHMLAIAPNDLAPELIPEWYDENGYVEGFRHENHRLKAIMWHPERETYFRQYDLEWLCEWL